jgi:hypothetical protein
MSTNTMSKEVGVWEALSANVKSWLEEVPQLGPSVQDLDGVILDAKDLQSVQDVHRRQLRETTQRSKDIRRRGRSLRNRLIACVQGAFGPDSLLMLEFGINPRLPKRRKRLTLDERIAKLTAELEAAVAAAAAKKN